MSSSKEVEYCKLNSITHLKEYLNIVGVIGTITPKIVGHAKMVKSIDLELSDDTMHNPGFVVKLLFDAESLDKFMKLCSRGLVLEVREMKIVKNEGVVYGEVEDEDDIKMYSDHAIHIPRNNKGKKISASEFLKSRIEMLRAWKKNYFDNICESDDSSTHSKTIVERKELRSSLVDKKSAKNRPRRNQFNHKKVVSDDKLSFESESGSSVSSNESTPPLKRPKYQLNSDSDDSVSDENLLKLTTMQNLKRNQSGQKLLKRVHSDDSINRRLKNNNSKKILSTPASLKVSANNTKKDSLDQLMKLLCPLARRNDVEAAKSNGDVSLCDINDIEYFTKIDLQCKVISEFKLLDECIQIIKVQDGTYRPGRTLQFPEASSWEQITSIIKDDPLSYLKEKTPVIDILVFDFTRLNNKIESGKFYIIENVMAIHLNIKGHKFSQGDLFLCVEGQNAYTRKMSLKQEATEEIIKRINSQKRMDVCKDIIEETPLSDRKESSKVVKKSSPGRRKLEEEKQDQLEKINDEAITQGKTSISDQGLLKKGHNTEKNIHIIQSEDLFPPGQTPPSFKELKEIMNEASELELPQTQTEDVHLKNTGSQLNYSEFEKNANLKSKSFRTSTQESNLSDTNHEDNLKNPSDDESSSIRSLKCSSLLPTSDRPPKNVPRESLDANDVSLSVIECYEQSIPNAKNSPHSKANRKSCESDKKIVLSERSLELKKVQSSYSSSDNNCSDRINSASNSGKDNEIKSFKQSDILERIEKIATNKKLSHVVPKSGKLSTCPGDNGSEVSDKESSDCDSGSLSVVSCDNISTRLTQLHSCSYESVNRPNKSGNLGKWYNVPKNLLNVSSKCFFKSNSEMPSSEKGKRLHTDEKETRSTYEVLRRLHIVKDSSYEKNVPTVPLETVWKLAYKNTVKMDAWCTRITPTPDSWKDGIKTKCSNCGTKYRILSDERFTDNRASNEESADQNTYTVQSVLCPESQCCSKLLDPPEFDFTLDFKVRNNSSGKTFTALVKGKEAKKLFGCTADDVLKSSIQQKRMIEVLVEIQSSIETKSRCKITLTRKNITLPESGPLLLRNIEWP